MSGEKIVLPASIITDYSKRTVPTNPHDKLWWYLTEKRGFDHLDKAKYDIWFSKAMKDDVISRSEMNDLLDGIGFFARIFRPSSDIYVINITSQAWDAYISNNPNGKCDEADDSVTVDQFIENFDIADAIGGAQGKGWMRLLTKTTNVIFVPKEFAGGVKGFLKEYFEERINKDADITGEQKTNLLAKLNKYLNNGDFEGLLDSNTDLDGANYFYFDKDNPEDLKNIYNYLKEAYEQTRGIANTKKQADTIYSYIGLNMLIGTGYSLQSVYEAQYRGAFDKSGYDTIKGIFDNIRSLTKKVEDLDARIKTETEKGNATKTLEDAKAKAQELLDLTKQFSKWVCIFCETKGDKNYYDKPFKDAGYKVEVKGVKDPKLTDYLYMFLDPVKIKEALKKLPDKEQENPKKENITTVPQQ